MELLKDLDYARIIVWLVPGAAFALMRSFSINGQFPKFGKDDFAALILGSVIYRFLLYLAISQTTFSFFTTPTYASSLFWFLVVFLAPSTLGVIAGLAEATDIVGITIRRLGVPLPSPTPTAWDTLFKTLPTNSVLIITLKNDLKVYGRWTSQGLNSAASTDPANRDLLIGEVGKLNAAGQYVPLRPQRGIYIASDEIKAVEVI